MNRAAPNCFITCHPGGGTGDQDEKLVRHFLENLRRFEKGELCFPNAKAVSTRPPD